MNIKHLLCVLISLLLCTATACQPATPTTDEETVTVRYLNFKPEIASVYEQIADEYERETGRRVIVETAANNTYEQTLSAKMATSDAPTIFQINGPRGYANWSRYCAPLSQTKLYQHLSDPSLAMISDGEVYGIPYVVEGYGIIYNNAILDRYFALPERSTDFASMDDITDFNSLKALVEDMQTRKEELGIQGVFACTSLKPGEDWRWQTHLANIPIYYEFEAREADLSGEDVKTIDFRYAENYRNIFDLYLNNSTTDPKLLGTKLVDESMAEFALGQCAMVQNGNWAWNQLRTVDGNTVREEDIKMLPIYTGMENDSEQGLCIGTESFLCINSKASEAEQQAAADFLYWLFSSETGKRFVTDNLNFIAPFDTFSEEERPNDPLAREISRYLERDDIQAIPWQFTLFPGQTFKDDFGTALLQYAQGKTDWEAVTRTVTERWKQESALL
ncbi:MAG: extracellular solute-binding protein [Clostridia bacterium]|nr:extracellular solute-binding protein [Clostridia bacterium]